MKGRRYIGVFLALVICSIGIQSQVYGLMREKGILFPAAKHTKEGKLYGYIDANGDWVVKPIYESAYPFADDVGIVTKTGKYGLVDREGKEIVAPTYESISQFQEGRGVFSDSEGMGVLDSKGQIVTKKDYSSISSYKEGLAVVGENTPNGNWIYGYINKDGKEVIQPHYTDANQFVGGKALVGIPGGKYALIDKSGKKLTALNYPVIYGYQENAAIFRQQIDGLLGVINGEGKVIMKPQYEMAEPFNEGVAIVSKSPQYVGKQGVINKTGKLVYPTTYNEIHYLGEGRLALGKARNTSDPSQGSIYAIGDIKGNLLSEFKYYDVSDYKDGKASVYDKNKTYFIDLSGKEMSQLPRVEGQGTLEEQGGIIRATIDGKTYYLSKDGEVIYEPNTVISLSTSYSVNWEKYKPQMNYLVYYPQVTLQNNTEVEKQINKKLKSMSINSEVTGNQKLDYNYEGNFDTQFYHKNLFIPRLWGLTYYYGAVHPSSNRETPVINLKTGEFYQLEDLFISGKNWKHSLNALMQSQAKIGKSYEGLFEDVKVEVRPNQSFYVDDANLYIYYDPYDIGPYAMGYVTFKIPFKQIDTLIHKKGGFWQAFH